MAAQRCIWGKDSGGDLVEITVSGLGEGGVPQGEKTVWVCPEHRKETEAYFAFVKRHGYRISRIIIALATVCVTAEIMNLCGMTREPFILIPWLTVFQIAFLLLMPYASWILAAQPSREDDWFWGVRHRLKWTKVIAVILACFFVFVLVIKLV